MIRKFTIKRGDTRPVLSVTATDSGGGAVDLTGATIRFIMRRWGDSSALPKVDASVNNTAPTTGLMEYAWQAADTDTAGAYEGEFQVTFAGGETMTVPTDGFIQIVVAPDLG